eukprot:SAG11_NODE_13710_length_642_cov_2.528545_1_plen_42_part_00
MRKDTRRKAEKENDVERVVDEVPSELGKIIVKLNLNVQHVR